MYHSYLQAALKHLSSTARAASLGAKGRDEQQICPEESKPALAPDLAGLRGPAKGQAYRGHRACTELTLDLNRPSMHFDNLLASWQSESGSNANSLGCKPGIENLFKVLSCNAAAGIGDANHHVMLRLRRADPDFAIT